MHLLIFALAACLTESRVQDQIDDAAYCEVADDCVDIGSQCPFGCNILVNEAEADRVSDLLDRYERRHLMTCVYDCAALTGVSCEDGRCVAEF